MSEIMNNKSVEFENYRGKRYISNKDKFLGEYREYIDGFYDREYSCDIEGYVDCNRVLDELDGFSVIEIKGNSIDSEWI